ncbi:hypothetical protein DV736_g5733, partial [Chaetothyriales sp. CBS 134916]
MAMKEVDGNGGNGLVDKVWELFDAVTGSVASALEFSASLGANYRRARFGHLGDLLFITGLVDTDTVRDIHFNINFWTDDEAVAWKSSYVASCNATSVAAAIFATLSLTALQLPELNSTHWTARACFVTSMVLGVLSVMTATSQQNYVGMINNPLSIRLWLSRGQPEVGKHDADNQPFNILPLESSVAAIKVISFPQRLLQLAVLVFLVGFGLYCLLSWLENITEKPSDFRNIFSVFMLTICMTGLYWATWRLNHINDERKWTKDFDLRHRGSYEQPYYLEKLKRDLQRVQNLAVEMEREQMELYADSHGVTVEELKAGLRKSEVRESMADRSGGNSHRASRELY